MSKNIFTITKHKREREPVVKDLSELLEAETTVHNSAAPALTMDRVGQFSVTNKKKRKSKLPRIKKKKNLNLKRKKLYSENEKYNLLSINRENNINSFTLVSRSKESCDKFQMQKISLTMLAENKICAICLNEVSHTDHNNKHYLSCGHLFHDSCITRWLNVTPICPNCKREIRSANLFQLYDYLNSIGMSETDDEIGDFIAVDVEGDTQLGYHRNTSARRVEYPQNPDEFPLFYLILFVATVKLIFLFFKLAG